MSPALSVPTSSHNVIEESSPSSIRPSSPISVGGSWGGSTGDSDVDSVKSISLSLTSSFEDWHTPSDTRCAVEFNDEDGAQIVLIPSASPFFLPPQPQFDKQLTSDCSFPSVCPTLSNKFDLLHSRTPLSPDTAVLSKSEGIVIIDSEPFLGDGFPSSMQVVGSVGNKTIPDFPEDIRSASIV